MVKNAGDLGSEDLLEKGMATHSSILAWRIPWTEEPFRLQFMGLVFCDCGFHSVYPVMDEDRGLWKLPDQRDWLCGKLGLVLVGKAMLPRRH